MRVTIGKHLKAEAKSIGMSDQNVEQMKTHFEQRPNWDEQGTVPYNFKGLRLQVSYDRLVNEIELTHIHGV